MPFFHIHISISFFVIRFLNTFVINHTHLLLSYKTSQISQSSQFGNPKANPKTSNCEPWERDHRRAASLWSAWVICKWTAHAGNLCRSPIAEAVMMDVLKRAGLQGEWHVDSAGIEGWHCDRRPDERALNVLARHNIEYNGRARVLIPEDFLMFDYIFGMDRSNLAELKRMTPDYATAKVLLLGDFGLKADERIIEDPYYNVGDAPFEKIYQQCNIACHHFLNQALRNQIM